MRWLHISDIHYNPDMDGQSCKELRKRLPTYLAGTKALTKIVLSNKWATLFVLDIFLRVLNILFLHEVLYNYSSV